MDAIAILNDEHQVIEGVANALEEYACRIDTEPTGAPQSDLARFVEFIGGFADRYHHGKEEDILFDRMEQDGLPRDTGPLAVMYAEHQEGRRLAGILAARAAQASPWTETDIAEVREAANDYAELLRFHIKKEGTALYPMAIQRLGQDALDEIGAEFERFEKDETGAGEHARLRALGKVLTERYTTRSCRQDIPVAAPPKHRHGVRR